MSITWLHQTDYRRLPEGVSVSTLLAMEYWDKKVVDWGVTEIAEGMTSVWVRWTQR